MFFEKCYLTYSFPLNITEVNCQLKTENDNFQQRVPQEGSPHTLCNNPSVRDQSVNEKTEDINRKTKWDGCSTMCKKCHFI